MGHVLGAMFGFVAAAGFTACLIVLLKVMLEVTSNGGFCARGGPYVIATECSDRAAMLPAPAIFGMLLFVGIGVAARGAGYAVAALAWPALFCTLGGGFIYSARFPNYSEGVAYGVGGMFIAMGGIPLLLLTAGVIRVLVRAKKSAAVDPTGVITESNTAVSGTLRYLFNALLLAGGIAVGSHAADWLLTRW